MVASLSQAGFADVVLLLGRCLLAAIFIASALDKMKAPARELSMIAHAGLPFPRLVEYTTGVFEIVMVAALFTGVYARLAAVALAAFLLLVSFGFVRFWSPTEPAAKKPVDRNTFFSNLSVTGGLLYVAVVGPGKLALLP